MRNLDLFSPNVGVERKLFFHVYFYFEEILKIIPQLVGHVTIFVEIPQLFLLNIFDLFYFENKIYKDHNQRSIDKTCWS